MKLFKIVLIILFLSFSILSVFLPAGFAYAGSTQEASGGQSFPNPLGEGTTVEVLIGRVIQAILGVVGSLALLMFIYGGLTWMTASGNKEKVEKGKDIIIWATLGLVVIFTSYVLVKFVITALTG